MAQSKGNSWAQNVEIREPGVARPAIRVERMELRHRLRLAPPRGGRAAGFRRPRVEIERAPAARSTCAACSPRPRPEASCPRQSPRRHPAAPPPARSPRACSRPCASTLASSRIEDGVVRFLDRTTTAGLLAGPVAHRADGHRLREPAPWPRRSSRCRASWAGTRALDIRGEIGRASAAPAFVDLVGELRSFKLPERGSRTRRPTPGGSSRRATSSTRCGSSSTATSSRPTTTSWSGSSRWRRPAAATRSSGGSGCPLGLIVALIKDQKGEIRATVPGHRHRQRSQVQPCATPSGRPSRTSW